MYQKNSWLGEPSSLLKMLRPVSLLDQALVHVHRAARLAGDRLGHEGGVHVVAQRRLAHRALEEEHLVGQASGWAWKKLISICPAPTSWISVSTFSSIFSQ